MTSCAPFSRLAHYSHKFSQASRLFSKKAFCECRQVWRVLLKWFGECLHVWRVLVILLDRETERQRDRETERQRDRETERQRDRETERQRDRET
jgi:hypothetical protein